MAVYMDGAKNPLGRMLMSHMFADTYEELVEMASTIGLAHKHLQNPGQANEHFDVSQTYRDKAIAAGAVEVNSRELVQIIRRRRAYLASIQDVHTPPAPEDIPDMDEPTQAESDAFDAMLEQAPLSDEDGTPTLDVKPKRRSGVRIKRNDPEPTPEAEPMPPEDYPDEAAEE